MLSLEIWLKADSVSNCRENETQAVSVILLLPKTLAHPNLEHCLLYCSESQGRHRRIRKGAEGTGDCDRFLLKKQILCKTSSHRKKARACLLARHLRIVLSPLPALCMRLSIIVTTLGKLVNSEACEFISSLLKSK